MLAVKYLTQRYVSIKRQQHVRGLFGNYWDNRHFVKKTEHHSKQPTQSSSDTYMGSWAELSHCCLKWL